MKAAVLETYNEIKYKSIPNPEAKENEVLVKVEYASICGTDQHIFKGEFHPRTQLPLVMGHEFAGVVDGTGKNAKEFIQGEKVVVDPIIWCGQCNACKIGHFPACEALKLYGIDLDGGFAEYISVPEEKVFKVDDSIPIKHAALVELLAIGFHANNRAGTRTGDRLLIWGAGKVGQSILQAAATKNPEIIYVVDVVGERLEKAKSAYPEVVAINANDENPVERIIEECNGVDIAFEAVGHAINQEKSPNPLRGCILSIRGAGTVCTLGLPSEATSVMMKELIWKEAKIVASRVSNGEYSEALKHLAMKKLKPEAMITSEVHVADAQEAFLMLEENKEKHLKVLLKI